MLFLCLQVELGPGKTGPSVFDGLQDHSWMVSYVIVPLLLVILFKLEPMGIVNVLSQSS